jgi:hypothetical protein
MKKSLGILFLLTIVAFSVIMLTKIIPYFRFERGMNFLSTKTDRILDNQWFMIGFYVHISSSFFVMFGGVFQFIPYLVKTYPQIHRFIGKIYVFLILILAAPSGLILAIYANGGLPAKVGFSLQCIVWWLTTFVAWREIVKQNYQNHINWMIRSFAVTIAAVSLRTESYILYYVFDFKPIETYLTVTWLSWTGNLLIAEVLIYRQISKRF